MDRFEYEIRAKEIVSLYKQGEYAKAVKIVDTIDWRRVQGLTMLYRVSDIYRHTRRYEESRDILLMANEISPNTKRVVYALCELSIILEDPVKAVEYFEQYKQIAPHEVDRFILQYKIYESHDVSLEERIAVLEKYKMYNYDDPDPKWTYELAYLYHRIGLTTRCVEECDELILWFGDGEYVYKALELKMLHAPLTPTQQEKYNARFLEKREAIALAEEATAGGSLENDVQTPMNISVKNVAPTKAKTTRIPSLRMGWKNRAAAPDPEEDADIRIADEKDRARYHRGYQPKQEPSPYEEDYEDEAEYGEDEVYEEETYPETEEVYEDEAYEEDAYEESEEYEDEDYEEEEYEESEEEYEEDYETVEEEEDFEDEDYEDEDYEEEEEEFEEEEDWEEEPAPAEDPVKIAETKDLSKAIGAVILPETDASEQSEEEDTAKEQDDDSDMRIVIPDVEDIKIRTIDAGNRFDTINLEEETSKYLAKEIVKLMEEDDMEAADATRALPMNSIFHDSIDSLQPHVISRAIEMAEEMNNERIARETGKIPQFGQGDTVEIEEVYSEEDETLSQEDQADREESKEETTEETAVKTTEQETSKEPETEPEEVEDDFVEIIEEDEEDFFDEEDAEDEEDFDEDTPGDEDMRQITVDEDMTEITADEDMTESGAEEEEDLEEYPEKDPDETFDPAMLFDDEEYEEEEYDEDEAYDENDQDAEDFDEEPVKEIKEAAKEAPEEKIEPIVFSQSKPLPKEFIEAVQIVAMEAAKEAAAAAAAAAASQVAAAAASQAAAAAATQVAQASQVQAAQVARQAAQEAAAATADAMKEMQPVMEKTEASAPAEAEKPLETAQKEPEKPMVEKQITGQLSFRDIIAEWEDVKKASEQQQIEEIKQKVKEQSSPLLNNYDNASAFEQNELNTISPMIDVFDGAEELEKEARSALEKEMESVSQKAEEELPDEEVIPEETTEPESTETYDDKAAEQADEAGENEPVEPASNFNTAEINGLEDKLVSALADQHYDTSNLQAEILHSILDEAQEKETKDSEVTGETVAESEAEPAEQETAESKKAEQETAQEAAEVPPALASSAAEAVAMAKAAQLAAQGAVEKTETSENEASGEEAVKEQESTGEILEETTGKKEMDVDQLYAQLMEKKAAEAAAPAQSGDTSEGEDGEEARVLTKEERDLFSHVANGKQMQQRLARIIDQASLEPLASNIRVVGENGTDPETIGKELVAAIGLYAPSVSDKSVVLTAEELSGQNMDSFLSQYNDGSIVITEAGSMTADTVSTLFEKAGSLSGLLIVLCDTDDNMQRLTQANPKVEEYASQKLVVDVLDNDGLVTFAQAYAKEKEYSIDEMGKLALYNRIEERQRQDHAVTTAEVRGIVDSAIEKVEKKGIGRFVDVLLAKRYDKEDMIVLREKDFMLDK